MPPQFQAAYLSKTVLEILQLALLNHEVAVIVKIFHDIVVSFFVVFEDDGFDGWVALDENP